MNDMELIEFDKLRGQRFGDLSYPTAILVQMHQAECAFGDKVLAGTMQRELDRRQLMLPERGKGLGGTIGG